MSLPELLRRAEAAAFDLDLSRARAWKERQRDAGGKVIAYLPIYVPREVIHAAGCLPVGIFGGGDRLEIIRGDAFFQSYICHLPRSVVELLVSGRLDAADGFLFPSICDVVRNLSGVFQLTRPGLYVKYIDVPQDDRPEGGGAFYERELRALASDLERLTGRPLREEALRESIAAYNRNRALLRELYDLRRATPWLVPSAELYLVLRAGCSLPVEEHTTLVGEYISAARASGRPELDHSRVVLTGAFCEQPPLGLIKTLERAGCYIVDDDFILGSRWLRGDVRGDGDPFQALVQAYLEQSVAQTSRYIGQDEKGRELVESVRHSGAEGVVFASASFCDPALLEQPMLQRALAREGIASTAFKFSEDTGQFAVIREQAGTFADSIRLWSETA